jgi:MFS family permease
MQQTTKRPRISRELMMIFLITFAGFLSSGIRMPTLPLYLAELGVSPQNIGLMISFFTFAVVLGDLFWGWTLDRFDPRWTLIAASLVHSLTYIGILAAQSIVSWYVALFVYGLFWAPIFIVGRWYMGTFAPRESKTANLAKVSIALTSSLALGGFLAGWFGNSFGLYETLTVSIFPPLLVGLLLLLTYRRLDYSPPDSVNVDTQAHDTSGDRPLSGKLALILVGSVAAMVFVAFGTTQAFIPLLASQVLGTGPGEVGILFGMHGVITLIVVFPMARLADRRGKGKLILFGTVSIISGGLAISIANNFLGLLLASSLIALGVSTVIPASGSWLSARLGQAEQGAAMGKLSAIQDVGWMIGPATGGILWEQINPRAPFLFAAFAGGVGFLIWLISKQYKSRG